MGTTKKNLKTIIDYIITKQNLKLKIQDVRAYRGPNCGTDHKLVAAKILFSYISTTKDTHKEKKENTVTAVDKKDNIIWTVCKMKVQKCCINRDEIIN
jgi:hypothetical protein